jgi:hypothetical protein
MSLKELVFVVCDYLLTLSLDVEKPLFELRSHLLLHLSRYAIHAPLDLTFKGFSSYALSMGRGPPSLQIGILGELLDDLLSFRQEVLGVSTLSLQLPLSLILCRCLPLLIDVFKSQGFSKSDDKRLVSV